MIYTTNDFLKYRMMEQQQKEQEASYRIEKNGPCQCVQTFDEQISDRVIKSTMCSRESAMSGKFHRKVISYAYYENHAHDNIDYFYQTKKNLIAIKQNYGQGWSMRPYVGMEIFQWGGVVKKFVEGDVGGIQMFKVLSVREIFSCFFPNF